MEETPNLKNAAGSVDNHPLPDDDAAEITKYDYGIPGSDTTNPQPCCQENTERIALETTCLEGVSPALATVSASSVNSQDGIACDVGGEREGLRQGEEDAPAELDERASFGAEQAEEAMQHDVENGTDGEPDETDHCKPSFDVDDVLNMKPIVKDTSMHLNKRLSSVVDVEHLARCQHPCDDVAEIKSFSVVLLDMAFEKQPDISSSAIGTLQKLGRKHPATVLRTMLVSLVGDTKPSTRVRSTVLSIVESTINPAIEAGQLDWNLADTLIKVAIEEMVSCTEPVPDIQLPAQNICVSIGAVYCKEVIQYLCIRLKSNNQPHSSIFASLGSLATLNVYGTVPHLQGVLELVVGLLGQIKSSHLRCSFATALAKFSEALLFYLANMERAPDASIHSEWFSDHMARSFETLYQLWLPCKVPQTCQEILEALGQMSQLMSKERLDQVAPKLVPTLIHSYKGPVEPLYVSRCFALFLDAFFNAELQLSDTSVQDMLQALFQQMTVQPDYGQPTTVKNNYEVLRCLERMARSHLDKVASFLLQKMELPAEKVRVASLTVIKHLVNSLKELLEPHVGTIGAQLRVLITQTDHQSQPNSVKKAIVQVIVALAVRGHLLASDTIHSGRHIHLIAYLLKLCTLPRGSESVAGTPTGLEVFLSPLSRSDKGSVGSINSSVVPNDELRQMCENVIQLLATTQVSMEGLFWPLFLRLSLDAEYSRAIGVTVRALAHLVAKKQPDSSDLVQDGTNTAAIVVRFLVVARSPLPTDKATSVLSFLRHYASLIHPVLHQLWNGKLYEMTKELKGNIMEQPANQASWLASLEKLVDATIATMKLAAPEWTQQMATAMLEQVSLYEQQPLERGFLLSLIGMAVHHDVIPQGPSYGMDFVTTTVRHQMVEESLGCASAIGWCARSHMDVALLKLQNMERNDYGRRSSGFLGFMKENRSEVESDLMKCTAARCFARIAAEAPPTELLVKVDKHVIRAVVYILQSSRDLAVRQEGLGAVASIAQALWPERLQERFLLAGRSDLLKETLTQLKSTPLPDNVGLAGSALELHVLLNNVRFAVRALDSLAALVHLPPVLRGDDQSTLFEAALERGVPMYAKLCRFAKEECWMVDASLAANHILIALENFSLQLLRSSLELGVVDIIFSLLHPWTKGQEGSMRRAALSLLRLVLTTFFKEVEFEPGAPTRFSQGHVMLAKILPRCTDPEGAVRDVAIDCIGLVLEITSKYLGYSREFEKPTTSKLESLKAELGSSDPAAALTELATILNTKTPSSDLWSFLESMTVGLADPFPTSSSGLAHVVCLILKARGGEVHLRVKDLLDLLLSRLKVIECPQTRRSILNGVSLLSSHQRDTVVSALLSHSLPYNDDISDCWKTLAGDSSQANAILDHLADILAHATPYEERGPHANEAIVSCRLLSAVSALKSMCTMEQISNSLQARFPQLFCGLLLAQSCMLGASPPIHFPANGVDQPSFAPVNREAYRLNPYQMAIDAFTAFLTCAILSPLTEPLAEHRHWNNAGNPAAFCDLVAKMTGLCSVFAPSYVPYCVPILHGALKSNFQRHRLTAVAFYAELVRQRSSGNDLDVVIRTLTSALPDSSPLIRRIALKGLGGLGDYELGQWMNFAPAVLNALADGLEEDGRDPNDVNSGSAGEALEGLTRLMPVAPLAEVERLASRLALRVRPFFEHESAQVRKAAVALLAQLFKAGAHTSARVHLAEQVHTTLTSLLLHLNEANHEVVEACKSALRQAGPLLDRDDQEEYGIAGIDAMFQLHLSDRTPLDYPSFLSDLVKLMSADCEEWVNSTYIPAATSYFKSPLPELRINAALYVGLLCGSSHPVSGAALHSHRNVSLSLTRLLHDPVKSVRLQAMNAISLMFGC